MSNFYYTTFLSGHLVTGRAIVDVIYTTNTTLPTSAPPTSNSGSPSWYFGTATVGSLSSNTSTTTTQAPPSGDYPEYSFLPPFNNWNSESTAGNQPVNWTGTNFRGDFSNPYKDGVFVYETGPIAMPGGTKGISSVYLQVASFYETDIDNLTNGSSIYISMSLNGTTFDPWYMLGKTGYYLSDGVTPVNGDYYFPAQNVPNSSDAVAFKLRILFERDNSTNGYRYSSMPYGISVNKFTKNDGSPLSIYPGATQELPPLNPQ